MLDWALYLKVELKECEHDDTTVKEVLSSRVPSLSHVLAGNAYFVFLCCVNDRFCLLESTVRVVKQIIKGVEIKVIVLLCSSE